MNLQENIHRIKEVMNLDSYGEKFEHEKKMIEKLISNFKFEYICGINIKMDDENDRVSSVILIFSRDVYKSPYIRHVQYPTDTRIKVKKIIKTYLGLENVYVGTEFADC
jgi:hypothetical protein